MARFNYKDADNYNFGEKTGFFSIQQDQQIKKVRFLYNTGEDIDGVVVHEAEVNGKKRYVNCLRDYNESVSVCPFCEAKRRQEIKVFVPVFNVEDQKVQFWERGKKFLGRLGAIAARYNPIVGQEFEVQRFGAKGSKDTTYEIMPSIGKQPDGIKIEDLLNASGLEEMPKVVGGLVLDKSQEEMREYLRTGNFPQMSETNTTNQDVVRRTPTNTEKF